MVLKLAFSAPNRKLISQDPFPAHYPEETKAHASSIVIVPIMKPSVTKDTPSQGARQSQTNWPVVFN